METRYLKGTAIAEKIKNRVKEEIKKLPQKPLLVSVAAVEDVAIIQYVESQKKICQEVGISIRSLSGIRSQEEILTSIKNLNEDNNVTGILLLLPLPTGIQPDIIQQAIAPGKDVEGIHPHNLGKLFFGDFTIAPCTAKAVWLILQNLGISLTGKNMTVVSQSRIIGSPLVLMSLCSQTPPTVTCCHKWTQNLRYHLQQADILVVAAGTPGLITGEMIKPGAVVIDVGINEIEQQGERMVVGDVDRKTVLGVASLLTPIQEGIGVVTTAVLMENVLNLAMRQISKAP